MADILAFPIQPHCGHRDCQRLGTPWLLWLEVKTATGKQSELQKSFQAKVESEGHVYAVVRSIDDVAALLP